jgi:hypothetical protein
LEQVHVLLVVVSIKLMILSNKILAVLLQKHALLLPLLKNLSPISALALATL